MKISNSKKQLAKIIHENGGWRDGAEFAAQDSVKDSCPCRICFYSNKPKLKTGARRWFDGNNGIVGGAEGCIHGVNAISNWHQTILSREEYFHLYPTPDADGWIERIKSAQQVDGFSVVDVRFRDGGTAFGPAHVFDWSVDGGEDDIISCRLHKPEQSKPEFCESVMRSIPEPEIHSKNTALTQVDDIDVVGSKPTIEQLAADYRNAKDYADRKQQQADDAKADADAKLAALVAAGNALGLVLSVAGAEPELVITDWRDLRVGDEVEYLDGAMKRKIGMVGTVDEFDRNSCSGRFFRIRDGHNLGWPTKWRFIRRP